MTASTWTSVEYEAVARWVGARTGLVFPPNRCDGAEAGIRRAMAKAAVAEVGRYLELLETGAVALDDLVCELTVGETYFFRETAQFDFIRREVLPDLLGRRGPSHVLRVWSAGCASGEEPYSMAILLDELGLGERAQVLGSDISRPALARARNATYGQWSLRGVDDATVRRHFCETRAAAQPPPLRGPLGGPAGGHAVLDERIQRRVSFGYLNLALDTYPSLASGVWAMDVILCRNVLIYFDQGTIRRVAGRLLHSLAPGGWLVAGPSDPPLSEEAPFEPVVTRDGVFYRRGKEGGCVCAGRPLSPQMEPRASAPEPGAVGATPPSSRTAATADGIARAREALAEGDYDRVLERVEGRADPKAAELAVRARANRDGSEAALQLAVQEARRHPLAPELHFLQAVLLLDVGRLEEAMQAVRRVLYLDRSLAMAHFVLGTLLSRRGELGAARRAYEAASDLAEARPDEPVPLGEGEQGRRLAVAARAQAALLEERRAS